MSDSFFPILSTDDIPKMLGRNSLLERIWGELTKKSPANLSIVGPRSIGKTVLLNSLVARAKRSDSPYSLVIYWQVGHSQPQSDDEFIRQLSSTLRAAMNADALAYKDYRDELQGNASYLVLKEVMDLLQMDERAVLMIWDGFDKSLSQGRLTGTLFSNLRDLFHQKRHRLVAASRQSLIELARSIDVEDSPLWEMFGTNLVRIEPFDDPDIEDALATASLAMSQGGKKELRNWTGGHPVLALSILNSLMNVGSVEPTNEDVNRAAGLTASGLSDFLDKLWNECSAATKNALSLLEENDGLDKDRIGKEDARYLLARGFAARDGSKLKPSCRLFIQHIRNSKPDTSTLDRLFGEWDAYRNEIRSILELRIKQIPTVNARLHRLVTRCLDDIPDYPNDCLNNLTSIEEIALDTIWQHEFGSDATVPRSVISYWTQPPRDTDNIIKPMMDADDWRLPRDRFKQLALLQRLTGSKVNFDAQAKAASKDSYVLLNAIHQFRNRTEHADGQAIHVGVAVSALLMCIELLSCLERELV